jgi:hypothetical protein
MKGVLMSGAIALTMVVGCGGASKNNLTTGNAGRLKSDTQKLWHRPMEVTHDFVDYCQGESSTTRFLWMRTGGDPASGGMSLSVFGSSSGLDGNGGWAAARAIDSVEADGIYIHRVVTEKSGLFVSTRRTFVRGRCVKLKPLGPISKERMAQDVLSVEKLKVVTGYKDNPEPCCSK